MFHFFIFFPFFFLLDIINCLQLPINSYSRSSIPYYISSHRSLSFLGKEPIPGISLYLGNPPQKMDFALTTRNSVSWVVSNKIEDNIGNKSIWLEKGNESSLLKFQEKILLSNLAYDLISLNNSNNNNEKNQKFWFLFFQKENQCSQLKNSNIDGEISLNPYEGSNKTSEHDSSFINILKLSNQIQNKNLAITYSSENGGVLFIDEDFHFNNYCILQSNELLSCNLVNVDLGSGNTFFLRENSTLFFDMANNFILAPRNDGKKLINIYRALLGKCEVNEKSGKLILICDKSVFDNMENALKYINFYFDNNRSFKIPIKDLFSENDDKKLVFKIFADMYAVDNTWIFGNIIFRSNVLQIDYDHHQISFEDIDTFKYKNKLILEKSKVKAFSRLFYLLVILLIVCLLPVIFLIFVYCYSNAVKLSLLPTKELKFSLINIDINSV